MLLNSVKSIFVIFDFFEVLCTSVFKLFLENVFLREALFTSVCHSQNWVFRPFVGSLVSIFSDFCRKKWGGGGESDASQQWGFETPVSKLFCKKRVEVCIIISAKWKIFWPVFGPLFWTFFSKSWNFPFFSSGFALVPCTVYSFWSSKCESMFSCFCGFFSFWPAVGGKFCYFSLPLHFFVCFWSDFPQLLRWKFLDWSVVEKILIKMEWVVQQDEKYLAGKSFVTSQFSKRFQKLSKKLKKWCQELKKNAFFKKNHILRIFWARRMWTFNKTSHIVVRS